MLFDIDMLNVVFVGPVIRLRAELPKVPAAGTENAAVLKNIAIVGFDDVDMSSHVEPRLTTIRVFKEEMGKLAMRRLVEIVRSKTQTVVTVHVPVELIVRESTRSLNASMPQLSATL